MSDKCPNPAPISSIRRSPRKHPSTLPRNAECTTRQETPLNRNATTSTAPGSKDVTALASSSEITVSPYNEPAFREHTRMAFFYLFLLEKTVKDLRAISKPFKLRIRNRTRTERLSRLVLYFHTNRFEDTSIEDCLSTNDELKDFLEWERDAVSRCATLSSLPDVGEFVNMLHFTDRKVVMKLIVDYKAADPGSGFPLTVDKEVEHGEPSFSLNEFARLIVILRDDELAKNALNKAIGKTLNRRQLDANVTRDSYWLVIANRFNDKNVDSKHSFDGRLDEVDSNMRPLCDRSASVLKKQYNSVKKMVTIARANWSTSGQNDPSNICNFLRMTPKGEMTADSKQAYVFFCVSRIGTANEVEDLLSTTSKLIEEDEEGTEEGCLGSGQQNQAAVERRRSSGTRNSGSYKDLSEISKGVVQSNKISEEKTAILREHLSIERDRNAGPQKSDEEKQRDEFDHRVKLATYLAESSMQIKRARDLHDEDLVELLQQNHSHLLKRFKKMVETSRPDAENNAL